MLDLSNPLSQTFDAMTPEQQAGLRALAKESVQAKHTATGEWYAHVAAGFYPGHAYRQKPVSLVIQHPTAPEGIYTDRTGNKIEVVR